MGRVKKYMDPEQSSNFESGDGWYFDTESDMNPPEEVLEEDAGLSAEEKEKNPRREDSDDLD